MCGMELRGPLVALLEHEEPLTHFFTFKKIVNGSLKRSWKHSEEVTCSPLAFQLTAAKLNALWVVRLLGRVLRDVVDYDAG